MKVTLCNHSLIYSLVNSYCQALVKILNWYLLRYIFCNTK